MSTQASTSRRRLLYGVAAAGAAVPLLAACGEDSEPTGSNGGGSSDSNAGSDDSGDSGSDDSGDSGSDGGGDDSQSGGMELAKTSDIPVGGGMIFKKHETVVTQPEEGTFKAFSAICTHKGCPVAAVQGGTINCECHGSKFKIEDGSVANGPATNPLAAAKVTVEGDSIMMA